MTSRAFTDLTDSGVLGVDHAVPVKKPLPPGWSRLLSVVIHWMDSC